MYRPLAIAALCALSLLACAPQARTPMSFSDFAHLDSVTNPPAPAPANCDAFCLKLRQEFRYVVYVGQQIYCYWDLKRQDTGMDFGAFAQTLEQSITTGISPTQYYEVLRRWASAFHDGHVNALAPSDHSGFEIYSTTVRLEVLAPATDHEKLVLTDATGADGASAGDEVIAVNGVPAPQALDQAEATVSGSTRRMRRYFAARRLTDVLDVEAGSQPLTLTIKASNGTSKDVTLARNVELDPEQPANAPSAPEPTGVDNFKATLLPGGLGYLRIDAFTGSQDRALLEAAMVRLADTQGLLIDLRKNGGGDMSGDAVIAHLIRESVTRYRVSQRMDDFVLASRPEYALLSWTPGAPFADWHDLKVDPVSQGSYAGKPVVALTSPGCFSACDTFSSALKTDHLATMVGEATGGGTGTPLVFDLPVSGNQFRYSVVRGQTAAGDAIEGIGTVPDVVIEPTQAERAAQQDQQLLSALDVLRQKIAAPAPAPAPSPAPAPGGTPGLASAVRALGLVWQQDASVSPTTADARALRRIVAVDER